MPRRHASCAATARTCTVVEHQPNAAQMRHRCTRRTDHEVALVRIPAPDLRRRQRYGRRQHGRPHDLPPDGAVSCHPATREQRTANGLGLRFGVGVGNGNRGNKDTRVDSAPFLPLRRPRPCAHTEVGSPNAAGSCGGQPERGGCGGTNENALTARACNEHRPPWSPYCAVSWSRLSW